MKAGATQVVEGPAERVEALWHEPARWPSWIDGFGHVVALSGDWPEPGAVLDWNSKPGGRGRVRERVLSRAPGSGHVVEIEDERLRGTQSVVFLPDSRGIRITLTFDYTLKERSFATAIVDALFIRRSIAASLQRTLTRFARERAADADLG